MMFMLALVSASAQKFYTPDEINVRWMYWEDDYSFKYLIENGKKVSLASIPSFDYKSSGANQPMPGIDIAATYCLNNKFIVLVFKDNDNRFRTRIDSRTYDYYFRDLYTNYKYVTDQIWYEIDFENIVYEPIYNRIMIPIGRSEQGQNAWCIDLTSTPSGVKSVEMELEDGTSKTYDLRGVEVDENTAKGVVIKKEGNTAKKYFKK